MPTRRVKTVLCVYVAKFHPQSLLKITTKLTLWSRDFPATSVIDHSSRVIAFKCTFDVSTTPQNTFASSATKTFETSPESRDTFSVCTLMRENLSAKCAQKHSRRATI